MIFFLRRYVERLKKRPYVKMLHRPRDENKCVPYIASLRDDCVVVRSALDAMKAMLHTLLYGFGLRGIVPIHSKHDTCVPVVW